jgi:type IV pilus assembly protein PilA
MGLFAAMAIPAFQKVRQASQEKAVLNNLRMLGAAADQYYLEHGVDTATYDDLVGTDKLIKQLVPVAGEDYRQLACKQGQPLRVRLSSGRVVEYRP